MERCTTYNSMDGRAFPAYPQSWVAYEWRRTLGEYQIRLRSHERGRIRNCGEILEDGTRPNHMYDHVPDLQTKVMNIPHIEATFTSPSFSCCRNFSSKNAGSVKFYTDACEGQNNQVKFLEHLQIIVDIDYTRRGNLAIHLTSPKGQLSLMLCAD